MFSSYSPLVLAAGRVSPSFVLRDAIACLQCPNKRVDRASTLVRAHTHDTRACHAPCTYACMHACIHASTSIPRTHRYRRIINASIYKHNKCCECVPYNEVCFNCEWVNGCPAIISILSGRSIRQHWRYSRLRAICAFCTCMCEYDDDDDDMWICE